MSKPTNKVGAGGRMSCPGCGKTNYTYNGLGLKVVCEWGWDGGYEKMLFVKVLSHNGGQRPRRK